LASQSSSAGIIEQSIVTGPSIDTVPFAIAATLNGCVIPQMPGPSISRAGVMKAEGWTRPRARQAFSAWVRQAGRSKCS
jgi:hypothetical protein